MYPSDESVGSKAKTPQPKNRFEDVAPLDWAGDGKLFGDCYRLSFNHSAMTSDWPFPLEPPVNAVLAANSPADFDKFAK